MDNFILFLNGLFIFEPPKSQPLVHVVGGGQRPRNGSIEIRCRRLIEAMVQRRGRYRNPQAEFTGELTFRRGDVYHGSTYTIPKKSRMRRTNTVHLRRRPYDRCGQGKGKGETK